MKKIFSILIILSLLLVSTFTVSAVDSTTVEKMTAHEILKYGSVTEVTDTSITIVCDRVISKEFSLFSSKTSEIHQKDVCVILLDGTLEPGEVINNLSRSTHSETDTDGGEAAKLYSTINFELSSAGGYNYIRLISASGNVVRFNSRTTVKQNHVRLGTAGFKENGVHDEIKAEYDFPNVYSWSVTAPSNFFKVKLIPDTDILVGCNYKCTLQRGTAIIEYTLSNNAYEP